MTDYALDYLVRGGMLYQTMQQKPLLKFLEAGKKTVPGGKQYISEPVKGAVMNDTAGFFAGVTNNSTLAFTQMALGQRALYPWKYCHAGFVIEFIQLLQDGITVTDGEQSTSNNSEQALTQLTGILKDATEDFAESWARAKNLMLWQDGSQDANQVPGVKALLLDDPTTGTVGSLSQITYNWWRSRVNLALAPSAQLQTLSKFLRNELIQLKKRGGRPNKSLCGSLFWDALMTEVSEKGIYTQDGFTGGTDIAVDSISLKGLGTFEYDPTLDDLGESKRCYVLDSSHIKLRPIDGQDNLQLTPARPYQFLAMLKSMTWAGGLEATQLNGMSIYGIA